MVSVSLRTHSQWARWSAFLTHLLGLSWRVVLFPQDSTMTSLSGLWVLARGFGDIFLPCVNADLSICARCASNPSSFTLKRLDASQRPGSTFTVCWLGTTKARTIGVRAHMFSGKPVTRLTWRIHLDLQVCPKVNTEDRYHTPVHVQHGAWCSRSQ